MDAIEHLVDYKWERPSHYGGHSPEGDYLIYSRNRDSEILDDCNYKAILKDLQEKAKSLNFDNLDESENGWVYDFRASHWACGWVEYIIVDKNAPNELLELAGEIVCAIGSYIVYKGDSYSEAQEEARAEYWNNESVQDRIDILNECECSIFLAKYDYYDLPFGSERMENLSNWFYDSEVFY